ncbi:AraC family transcriptional regulator [Photobacterium sanctipauli]|uniref:AraC family transcriptional regulator n=1 Tax=Photobacterium sanctipauli TaxID=1342794 RepID=A0A2T3P174_9GAMM|nr:helix-turn-helix domain-containing protein [Photobacterium sanctipauli]PSW22229.1 AraC family transcriptional regulator [Photobacterium sanctipauli]
MESEAAIPRFFLYGEENDSDDSEFVHIESIAARSEKQGWKIKPHRHGKLFQLLIIYQGEAKILLDNKELSFDGGGAVVVPTGVVHGFVFSPETLGHVLTIAEPLINQAAGSRAMGLFDTVIHSPRILRFSSNSHHPQQLKNYFDLLSAESDSSYSGKRHTVEWLAKLILMTLYREIEHCNHQGLGANQPNQGYYVFQQLVEKHFRQQWTVARYANQLQMSLSTLNRICKTVKGVGAKAIISDRLFIEAKRSLLYTQLNIDQIAYNLGYDDPAYFSRFFKNKSGLSPKQFRQLNPFDTEF